MQRVLSRLQSQSSAANSVVTAVKLFWHKQTNPSNEDTALIRTNCYVPRVSSLADYYISIRLGVIVTCNGKDYRKQCNSNNRDFWIKRIIVIVIDKYSYVVVISIKRFLKGGCRDDSLTALADKVLASSPGCEAA